MCSAPPGHRARALEGIGRPSCKGGGGQRHMVEEQGIHQSQGKFVLHFINQRINKMARIYISFTVQCIYVILTVRGTFTQDRLVQVHQHIVDNIHWSHLSRKGGSHYYWQMNPFSDRKSLSVSHRLSMGDHKSGFENKKSFVG